MTPLVSVVVTTYNHEKYLAKALDAILEQRCNFGVEIILGEDCSSDGTLEVCKDFAHRYPDTVKLIASTENVGWRRNYRRCVEAASGKYVAFCDGDDYWCDASKLQTQVDFMEANPEYGMCYTRSERRDEANYTSTTYPPQGGHEDFESMLRLNTAENCTTLAKRCLVEQYYSEIRPDQHPEWLTDDLPMWLWFSANYPIHFIDCTMAVHRIFSHSVSHSTELEKRLAFSNSLSNIKLWYDEHYNSSKRRKEIVRERMNTTLWVYSHIGSVGDFVKRWWQEVKENKIGVCNIVAYGLFMKKIMRMLKKLMANG